MCVCMSEVETCFIMSKLAKISDSNISISFVRNHLFDQWQADNVFENPLVPNN